jgi:GDPmannose 4,6-dehydratase
LKAIIFGHTGQDGIFLTKLLESLSIEVYGVSRSCNLLETDISDFISVKSLIDKLKPNFIFHLAAISKTSHEFTQDNFNTISLGTFNILEAVYQIGLDTKIFITGSGLQFQNKNIPINEESLFEPRDSYSMSRIHSVYSARYYRSVGISVHVGYLYNHDSEYRNEHHMSIKILNAANRIANGSNEKIQIGDLNAIKEYGYAADIVSGIWILINQNKFFEANIGTGIGYSIKDWLQLCFSKYHLDFNEFIFLSENFVSPYSSLVSDTNRINSIGWTHKTDFENLFDKLNKK